MKEYCLLECKAVYFGRSPSTFRRIVLPPFSGSENKRSKKSASSFQLAACFLVSYLAFLTLKMEAERLSEMSVDFFRTTRPYNPKIKFFKINAVRTSNYIGIAEFLGFAHRPIFKRTLKNKTFRRVDLFPLTPPNACGRKQIPPPKRCVL
jgi:hypothetical protein